MQLKIFNRIFEINFNIESTKKEQSNEAKFKRRIMYIILVFLLFSFISVFRDYNNNEYYVGKVINKDLISPKQLIYQKNILDKSLKEDILRKTKPVYNLNPKVKKNNIEKFKKFLSDIQELNKDNLFTDDKIFSYIEDNAYVLSVLDVKYILKYQNEMYNKDLLNILSKIYDTGVANNYDVEGLVYQNNLYLTRNELNVISNFIVPNLKIDVKKTKEKIKANLITLKNYERKIKKGEIIAKKGTVITNEIQDKILRLGLADNNKVEGLVFKVIFHIFMAISFYFVLKKTSEKGIKSNGYYPSLITFIFILGLNQFILGYSDAFMFLLPFLCVPIITILLSNDSIFAIFMSMLTNILLSQNFEWFVIMSIMSVLATNSNKKISNRLDLVKNCLELSATLAIFSILWGIVYNYDVKFISEIFFFSISSLFITAIFCLGIMPYFEKTFSILTDIKLLELGDYSFPLLKRLLLEAPGTFYHSIMVGALAEQAASEIGANPTLARVGAYYHDIGKLKRPLYFVENQGGDANLHDNLNPSVSAIILTSHTKDGYAIAKSYGLPKEILDIILQHHGTTAVQYFYYKAVEQGENVDELDFRYKGEKPQSKEAIIIMLADTVEAAVRASSDKSREGIENTIRYLIKYKMDDNQLVDSDITFKDIEKIVNAFLKVLTAAYHNRIKYPKINDK